MGLFRWMKGILMKQQLIHTLVLVKWLKDIFRKLSKPEIGLKHCVLVK